ncbi:MAG: PQQ-binding-like beta-propeller repeat protein [Limisphaerales bacterium]
MKFIKASLVVAVAGFLHSADAADWPRWRGTDHTDHCQETGLLKSWPANGPKQSWVNKNAGLGYASYSIVDGVLYTMGLRGESEQLIALNVSNGKELFAANVGGRYKNGWGDGPRSTPTIDGNRVYAMGGHGDLICADKKNGRVIWKASMARLGGKRPNWGYCESVLIDDGKVICTPGGPQGAMAALDKNTGRVIWQSEQWTDGAQYSSVVPATIQGRTQYVQLTQKSLVGIDAKNGDVIWKSPWQGRTAVIPTPIVKGNEVYIASGYGVGCKKVRVGRDGSVSDVWVNKVMKNHHGGVILVGDHLYGYSDGPGWTCQSWDTGEEVWAEKRALRKGAIYYADGKFILLEETSGRVALIDASSKGWNEISRFQLAPKSSNRHPKGKIWSHIVISGGKMFVRDQDMLVAYDVKG